MYTYGSNLEMNAPRLNAPGDFLTYVLFVSTVILVSYLVPHGTFSTPFSFIIPFISKTLAYLPAQPTMTEAVPGSEEDHPCISYSPLLFAILLGLYAM